MTTRSATIALAASVLLNIFLIAAVIGGAALIHGRGDRTMGPRSLRIVGSELPRDARRNFRRHLRDARLAAGPDIAASRTARQRAASLLEQRVLDRAALEKALAEARAADLAVRARLEFGAVDFIAGLAPADRMRLAEAMRRRTEDER